MISDQFLTLVSLVAFLSGASAILRVRTMQNTINQQRELLDTQDRKLVERDGRVKELETKTHDQQRQIDVLTSTVNSSELIKDLDAHLAQHHNEAMERLDRMHADLVSLAEKVTK